jgi:hypothetical protein
MCYTLKVISSVSTGQGYHWATVFEYTRCFRRKLPYFRRMFLRLNEIDTTKCTYIQSRMVTETMVR